MNYELTLPQRIKFYHCNGHQDLSLRAYLEWSVEMGNLHLESRGITWQQMREERQIILLSRLAYTRLAPATYGQNCRFTTWEYGVKGPQFIRNFSLEGEDGRVLAQSTSAWILVDPVERKILRPSQCLHELLPHPREVSPEIQRFRLPEMPVVARHQVRPSQIDGNGHMGNQFYADLLTDYAPAPFAGRTVQSAQMTFDHEAREGEVLTLCAEATGPESYAMSGRLPDGRKCFEALITVVR